MSGEQHAPTDAELIATAVKDARAAEELIDGLEAIEYGPEQDYLSHLAEHVVSLAIRLEDAAEVRALPDRETLARAIDPEAWRESEPGRVFPDASMQAEYERNFWQSVQERRQPSLRAADAVLALFGQESQR